MKYALALLLCLFTVPAFGQPCCPVLAPCTNPKCECDPCTCGPDCACDDGACKCDGCGDIACEITVQVVEDVASQAYSFYDTLCQERATECLKLRKQCDNTYNTLMRKAAKHRDANVAAVAQELRPGYMIAMTLLKECAAQGMRAQLKFNSAPDDELKLKAASELVAALRSFAVVEGLYHDIITKLETLARSIGTTET